jgi:hypothetical protein
LRPDAAYLRGYVVLSHEQQDATALWIRKSLTALAMVLDLAGVAPNPARDRVQVRRPREEPEEPEPPAAPS